MEQSRWRSPVLWAAVFAQIVAIGQFTGLWSKWGIDPGMVGDVVASVLQLLVLFGILNNPVDKTNF
jgi:uncharacterized membrane protein